MQPLKVVGPQLFQLVLVASLGKVGDGEDEVVGQVALLHQQLDIGLGVVLVVPPEAQIAVLGPARDGGLPDFVMAPRLAPRQRQAVAVLSDVVGKPAREPLGSADEMPDDALRIRPELVLNVYFILTHYMYVFSQKVLFSAQKYEKSLKVKKKSYDFFAYSKSLYYLCTRLTKKCGGIAQLVRASDS